MKNCLIVLNKAAGGSKKISFEKVEKCLGDKYIFRRHLIPDDGEPVFDDVNAVAVCGGDGTLSRVMQKIYDKPIDIWYFPSGTLNDKAKSFRYEHLKTSCPSAGGAHNDKSVVIGRCDQVFTYVLACGSFTPIGYAVEEAKKKKFGVLAYVAQVLKQYKINRIYAKINCGDKCYTGDFTLIMLIKSPRCFGFDFNRDYDPESISGHLVAIRAPKRDGIAGLAEMFIPFFRVFFVGLDKEMDGNIIFRRVSNVSLTHNEDVVYCRDGEEHTLKAGAHQIDFVRSKGNFNVIQK